MKKQYLALSLLTPVLCPALTAEARTPKENKVTNREQPNVIVILADDLGYGDLECYGAKNVQTPNVNRLAGEGIRFTNAHTVAATSTPSRYSLLTGEYAWRRPDTDVAAGNAGMIIRPEQYTMADMFKNAGYTTCAIGKWHLGLGDKTGQQDWNAPLPAALGDLGFDYHYIMAATADRVPCVFIENGKVANYDPSAPIEVSYKQNFPGEPTGADHPELLYNQKPSHGHDMSIVNGVRGDAIVQFDWSVGQIMETLDKLGLAENTLIILSSDNGPVVDDGYDDKAEELLNGHSPAGPWRGNKYSAFEGGTAVPAIVRWPKKIKENRESDVLMSQIDWMASLGALVNARLPKGSAPDSYNRIGNLLGTDDEDRPWVIELASNHVLSVRTKDWKYIEPNDGPAMIQWGPKIETGNLSTPQLYDMRKEINERANVALQHPEVVYDMQNILRRVRNKTIKME